MALRRCPPYRCRMENILRRAARTLLVHSRWIPVAGGALYFALWVLSEAGRFTSQQIVVVFVLFAIAIAVSGFFPIVSLGLITAIPLLQLLGWLYPPTATTWPVYSAAGAVGLVIAFRGEGVVRRLVLPVGIVTGVLYATRIMLPSQEGYWTMWVGGTLTLTDYPNRESFITLLFLAIAFFVGMWALGLAGRSLLREREIGRVLTRTDLDLRLSEDRARISRDVHDTLAHSLAVIVSQAEGAMALAATKPKVAVEALGNIATVGRSALVDVRSLVESIHEHDLTAPKPTIDDLPSVVSHLRGAGMEVAYRVLGTPRALSASHDLGVFRIVQESLTNALRHGGTNSSATVTLDWQGTGLAILVASTGTPPETPPVASRGVGIEGMKERARLMGGWLTAEPSDDGAFIVTAYVPVAPNRELADA